MLLRQILGSLYSFMTRTFDLEQVDLPLLNPRQSRLDQVKWISYFNALDPVSGRLDYSDVDANMKMPLPGPRDVAYDQYGDDREFFSKDIAGRFLARQDGSPQGKNGFRDNQMARAGRMPLP